MKQTLLVKFAVVFVFHGLTAEMTLVITLLSQDTKWLVLVPVLKASWQTLEKHLAERGLLGANEGGQPETWH